MTETIVTWPIGWKARPYQRNAWRAWRSGIKRELLIWHRRAGKDDYALAKTSAAAHERIGNYWHCLPMYEQARKAIWEAIDPHSGKRRIDVSFPPEYRKSTNNTEMKIELLSGSIWRVVGSDNPDSLVGAPPAGIVFSEWALANPAAWGYLSPILLENGGWASFITTPRGNNHAKKMLDTVKHDPKWFTEVLSITDTLAIHPDAVEDQRATYRSLFGDAVGDMLIEQEFYCSFAGAMLGSYYGDLIDKAEREGRITTFDVDPKQPVHTAWDLGKNSNNTIWCFQVIGPELRVVDFHAPDEGDLEAWCGWLKEKGYHGNDYVPHDIMTEEWGTKRTRFDLMRSMGRKPVRVAAVSKIEGINAARMAMKVAKFHATNCDKGIDGLRNYRREWDDDLKRFRDQPVKDWADHIADGFRYLALAWRDATPKEPPKKPEKELVYTVGADGVIRGNLDVRKAVEALAKKRRALG